MSVESKYKPVSYSGTGGTSVFPFGWVCYEKTWIHVSADGLELTQGTDYTVALESTSGGSITLSAPLAAGKVLIIWMDVPITQENRYPNTGQLNTVTIEKALDKQTLISQQLQDGIERSVKVPVGSQEKPEDVVRNIYVARDAAAASADAATASADAASAQATAAKNSADTAAQTVQTATAQAVADATAQATAAHNSALDAAQSAAEAAAASGGLAGRVDAVEIKNTQQDTRLTNVETKNTQQDTRLTDAETALAGKATTDLGNIDLTKVNVLLQQVKYETGSWASSSALIPMDDTIPQITEGTQVMSVSIVPKKANSKVTVEVKMFISGNGSNHSMVAIFKDSDPNAIASCLVTTSGANYGLPVVMEKPVSLGDTSQHTFSVRMGPYSGTMYMNGNSSGRLFGGTFVSSITLKEHAA